MDNQEHFKHIKEIVVTKFTIITMLIEFNDFSKIESEVNEVISFLEDFNHAVVVGKKPHEAKPKDGIHQQIEALQKKLNRLSDFIVIANQDKILKEMGNIHSGLKDLDTLIYQHIKDNF